MQIPHQIYKIDLNNINEPLTRMIESVNDKGVRFVDVELWANSQKVTLPQNSTATAAFVTDGFLINESVNCSISDDLTTVIVPIDNSKIESKSGIMLVEIKITDYRRCRRFRKIVRHGFRNFERGCYGKRRQQNS